MSLRSNPSAVAFAAALVLIPALVSGPPAAPLSSAATGGGGGLHSRTLFAQDPLRRTVSLDTGAYGTTLQGHQVVNVDSDLDFGGYLADGLTAGVQGGEVGEILDLGTQSELAQRYGYQETVGQGQGFASIHFEGGQLVILQDYATQTFQPFAEGNAFLAKALPASSVGVGVKVGHVYLVRVGEASGVGGVRVAKLLVVGFEGGERVEVTWGVLRKG